MTRSPTRERTPGPARAGPRLSRSLEPLNRGLALGIGVGAGASGFLGFGYYDLSIWGPLALGFAVLALALWIGQPFIPAIPGLLCVGGLLLLGGWAYLSTGWAESPDQTTVAAARWLLYGLVLFILLAAVRDRGTERLLVAAVALPVLGVAGYLLVRMAAGDGSALFLGNRLNSPLEYVNGMASYLLVAFWPLHAVAERARAPALAGAGLAGATVVAGFTVMTQSRGAIAALVLSAVVLLVLVPGRMRRGWALLLAVAGVLASVPELGDVLATLPPGEVPADDEIATAAWALIAAAAVAGSLWALALAVAGRLHGGRRAAAGTASTVGLVLAATLATIVLGLPPGERLDQVERQYETFTELEPTTGGSRLATGGGNRYDYWRIALDQVGDAPVKGVGAGNYDTTYFAERRTTEDVRNPHSIELQLLGETGLVGGLAFGIFVAGALIALWRRARPRLIESDPGLALAGGGILLLWLAQTSVDWLHLIPGLTGIALCACAALIGPPEREVSRDGLLARPASWLAAGGIAALLSLGLALPYASDRLVASGGDKLDSDPRAASERAADALAIDDESIRAYRLQAAARARLGDYEGARRALLEATRRKPSDSVNWALLGDLALRRGDLGSAQSAYSRAAGLNPRDQELAALASRRDALAALQRRLGTATGSPTPGSIDGR